MARTGELISHSDAEIKKMGHCVLVSTAIRYDLETLVVSVSQREALK